MTLEDGIKYEEKMAEKQKAKLKLYENMGEDRPLFSEEEVECKFSVEHHEQLASWLRELKDARDTLHAMYGSIGYP